MSEESRREGGPTSSAEDESESLNTAINELENVLNRRQVLADESGPDPTSETPGRGEQYSIPLLHDVVEPAGPAPARNSLRPDAPGLDPVQAEAEPFRPIIERLASEIEVIVQTGVEEALKAAGSDILRKVIEHVEIVLPEILEELSHLDRKDET